MQKYANSVQLDTGKAIAGATITVTEYPSGDAATIYSDNGITAYGANIITADSTGEYSFYAANGHYSVKVTTAYGIETLSDVILFDPDDVATASMSTDRVLGRVAAGDGAPEQLTISQALDMVSADLAAGDIIYRSDTGWQRLEAGTAGYVLNANGPLNAPSWEAAGAGAGSVTSVAATVPSFLSISGTPITTSGTLAFTLNAGDPAGLFLGTPSSANLRALVSDETGTGSLVFANTPTLVTPILGVATATSINKVAFTTPATSATLTIADGKTLTASNSITLAGTDSTTMTFPPASASIGYINIPQNSQSAAYTTVLADQGKHLLHPSADTTARTFTIDSNANVPYAVGTCITFVNQASAGTLTISITSDTMRLAGAGTTGSRTLAANGVATALKITSTEWIISGTGLT